MEEKSSERHAWIIGQAPKHESVISTNELNQRLSKLIAPDHLGRVPMLVYMYVAMTWGSVNDGKLWKFIFITHRCFCVQVTATTFKIHLSIEPCDRVKNAALAIDIGIF